MSPEIAVAIIGGLVTLSAGVLERRHSRRMRKLEQQNSDQHARGYGLLESIDKRTQATDEKVDALAIWAAVHDAAYPSGHTTINVITKEPAKS
jgi:hypothetical protein